MSVASKNLFAALGSDDESDSRPVVQSASSKTEPKPTKHDNAAPRGGRSGDRGERGGRGGRGGARGGRGRGGASRGGYSNEDALKDSADVRANRERDVSETRPRGASRGARATGGGRGREHDRHSATGRVDSQKAVDQGWGKEATSWESAAPIAEADRQAEKIEASEATAVPDAEEPSPQEAEKEPEEEPTQTYADYLASQMKTGFSIAEVRKPDQTKWEASTSLLSKKARQVEEALFGEKTSEKSTKSTATKKTAPKKVVLDIEQRFTPAPRGGRGEGRGGRGGRGGSGESRGTGRGRGDGTSRGRGRGEDRGTRGRGGAGGSTRGGRGGAQTIDVADTNAFPALG